MKEPMSTSASRALSRPLAILLSLALAIAGLLSVPLPASAAVGDVTGGSASWGVDAAYRAQFTTRSATGGATIAAGDLPTWGVDAAASTWDAASRTGVIQLTGTVRLGYLAGAPIPGVTAGNYVHLVNPIITLSGDTGTIAATSAGSSHDLSPDLPTAAVATRTIATLDLAGVNPAVSGDTLTWSAVPVAIAAGGAEVLASYPDAAEVPVKRAVGSPLDAIDFSLTLQGLTPTATTLAVSPEAGTVAGQNVTLTATVSPAVDGSVEFFTGTTSLGTAPAIAGVATLVTSTLVPGTHAVTASFTPDGGDHAASTSAAVTYPVVATAPTTGAAWGLSTYLNAGTYGRPSPLVAQYTAPASYDATSKITTWGSPSVVSNADGTVTLSFAGASFNHSSTGGAWLRLADLQATLDRQGNGTVSAVVTYGTVPGTPGNIPFNAATAVTVAGPERVDIVTLAGNATSPVAVAGGATWSGLAGEWNADFLAFLAGEGGAAAWSYASTITNTGATDRRPAPFTFTLGSVPTFAQYATDAAWGLSTYLNAGTFGRPSPLVAQYGAPTTLDATTRVSTFTSGTVVSNADRTITVSYPGSTFNHSATGGAWLRLADPVVTVDESGNGSVSAVVTYGTVPGTPGNIPYNAATAVTVRGPERVDVLTLTGNDADLVVVPAGASFSGLAGEWDADFVAFLAGDASADPAIAAWSYASTITNTGATDRKPAPLTLRFATAPVFTGTAGGGEQPGEGSGETPTTPPAATPAPGTLTWGVKASFRSYILGGANGSIATSGGAGSLGSGFWFPQSGASLSADGLGSVAYRGTLAFTGHGGVLSVRLGDPVVRLTSATSGVLSVVTANGRVDFATLDLAAGSRTVATDGTVSYAGVPATLTAAGAAGFAGFYAAGESLDPVSFTIGSNNSASGAASTRAATSESANTPPPTPPATEGVTSPQSSFVEGATATFTADGFQPDESGILAVVYSEPTVLADDLTADADGVVTWTGALPRGLTGQHTFTFQGSVDRGLVIEIAAAEVVGCPVDGVELDWGFKESFRAYLDSSIAHGAWEVADGATYAAPLFGFTGSGGYDAETGDADLAFGGSVRFTGHEGVLDTTISNLRVVVDGDRAVLLLDVSGSRRDGGEVAAEAVEFATLDLAAAERTTEGDVVTIAGIPAVLTPAGSAAFGTYDAGSDLDPLTLRIPVGAECAPEAATEVSATALRADGEPAADTSWILWLVVGIVALLAIAIATVLLVRRGRAA